MEIALQLTTGADAHLVPDFLSGLKSGHILSLADTRYVLVEPPHHVAPPRIEEFFFGLLVQGYVPVLTHPERLTWIEANYPIMEQMCDAGVWMQVDGWITYRRVRARPAILGRENDEGGACPYSRHRCS